MRVSDLGKRHFPRSLDFKFMFLYLHFSFFGRAQFLHVYVDRLAV